MIDARRNSIPRNPWFHRPLHPVATRRQLRGITLAAALALAPAAQAADIISTEIDISAIASNVTAISIPGSQQRVRVWIFRRTRNNPTMEASVEIGVVRICNDTRVSGSRFNVNVMADGIYSHGARIRIGEIDLCPD